LATILLSQQPPEPTQQLPQLVQFVKWYWTNTEFVRSNSKFNNYSTRAICRKSDARYMIGMTEKYLEDAAHELGEAFTVMPKFTNLQTCKPAAPTTRFTNNLNTRDQIFVKLASRALLAEFLASKLFLKGQNKSPDSLAQAGMDSPLSIDELLSAHQEWNLTYDQLYYPVPLRATISSLCLLLLCIGVFGNILVIVVVATARVRMLTPTNCYLVSLSLADLIALVVGVATMISELNVTRDRWVLCGIIGCKISVYLSYVGVNTSAFSITAFSVERFVAICYPITAQTACTVKRAKRIIAGIWIFGLLYNSPWFYLATLLPKPVADTNVTIERCGHKLDRSSRAYMSLYLGDLALFYFIPLVLLSVLYSAIARVLFRSSSTCQGSEPLRTSNATRALQSRIQASQHIQLLILWLPYRFMVVYNSFAPRTRRIASEWYVAISRSLIFVNSTINPIIYNAMSVKFRREFKRLLTCL
uniref:Thyrotropin-releasing hormone receptor n=1 Tax=Macrostomum lignano TaxID=282301 RepID=A0A1I8IA20_9PLAT